MPPRPPIFRPPTPGSAKRRKTSAESGDRNRELSRARGYDRTWERLRRMHLNARPWCKMCDELLNVATVATICDHVIPIEVDPSKRLDPDNLQSLCKAHHDGLKQRQDRAL